MEHKIKMIALDLDGTTLKDENNFSQRTIDTLSKATEKGIHVVISTGRTFKSLPEQLFDIKGIEYVITSNGAHITRLEDREIIYENIIGPEAVERVVETIGKTHYTMEAFVDGTAYMTGWIYDDIKENGSTYRDAKYVVETRHKVDDIFNYTLNNKHQIENISITFPTQEDRRLIMSMIEYIPDITITSSFDYNIEIGGATTSKGEALKHLMKEVGVTPKELMAAGDSPNDLAMIRLAGLGVAVANAKDEVKREAQYITDPHYEDGVAKAIELKVLNL